MLVTHGAFLHYLTENWSETVYVAHKLSGVTVAETSIIPQLGMMCNTSLWSSVRQFPSNFEESRYILEELRVPSLRIHRGIQRTEGMFGGERSYPAG